MGILDLLALLAAWGDCPVKGECSADLDGDGTVGILDLVASKDARDQYDPEL